VITDLIAEVSIMKEASNNEENHEKHRNLVRRGVDSVQL